MKRGLIDIENSPIADMETMIQQREIATWYVKLARANLLPCQNDERAINEDEFR